ASARRACPCSALSRLFPFGTSNVSLSPLPRGAGRRHLLDERRTEMSTRTIQHEQSTAPAENTSVFFPEGKRRGQSPIFTHNELFIAAPAERIFAALVRATEWPTFYGNAKDVVIEGGADGLTLGTLFHWTTFGVRVHTTVEELLPNRRLAWSGRGLGSSAYH